MPTHDTSTPMAVFLGEWISTLVYGFNVALYLLSLRILLNGTTGKQKQIMIGLTSFQFVVATAQVISSLIFLIRGFVTLRDVPDGIDIYYQNQADTPQIAEWSCWIINYCITDTIMAWRCFTVWGRDKRIGIFLISLLIASPILGFMSIAKTALLTNPSATAIFTIKQYFVAFFSLSMASETFSTAMIAWKIWQSIQWRTGPARSRQIAILLLIVESGVLLTLGSLTDLTLLSAGLNAGQMIAPIIGQVSFLVSASIVVRVELQKKEGRTLPVNAIVPARVHYGSSTDRENGLAIERSEKGRFQEASMDSTPASATVATLEVISKTPSFP